MSLAAVPVYLWGRTLVSRRAAFAAAALTVATPVLAYSGLVMTGAVLPARRRGGPVPGDRPSDEAEPDPDARRFRRSVRHEDPGDRPRAGPHPAALVDAGISRSWRGLRRHLPAAADSTAAVRLGRVAAGIWLRALGGYEVVAKTSYSVGAVARFVMYHGASLLILCGLVPAAAVTLMLVEAVRRGESDERSAPTSRSRFLRCGLWSRSASSPLDIPTGSWSGI
jgi:hypothetical protein